MEILKVGDTVSVEYAHRNSTDTLIKNALGKIARIAGDVVSVVLACDNQWHDFSAVEVRLITFREPVSLQEKLQIR